jgi:hypothetical protein
MQRSKRPNAVAGIAADELRIEDPRIVSIADSVHVQRQFRSERLRRVTDVGFISERAGETELAEIAKVRPSPDSPGTLAVTILFPAANSASNSARKTAGNASASGRNSGGIAIFSSSTDLDPQTWIEE